MMDLPSTAPAIELRGVTKRFGKKAAVDGLSLSIPTGQVFGFLGPNGAGKSTTIKILMDLVKADSGRVKLLGLDVGTHRSQLRQRVGYVPEQHFMPRWMRIGEAIRFCRAFYPTWNDELCRRLLDMFDLDERTRIKHLSKGMAVKLALLLAVSYEPEVLILDEPMSGLDPLVREEFLQGVLRVGDGAVQTVLFSSHTLGDVERMADSVGIICEGKLVVHSEVDELLARTKRIRAVLLDGRLPTAPPEGTIFQSIQRREWLLTVHDCTDETLRSLQAMAEVSSVEMLDISLEEIFKDHIRGRRSQVCG